MHKFVFKVTKNNNISLLSAILYITAPYKFTDIYIRFAIGEFTSFVFLPMVFLGVYSLIENQDEKDLKYLVIGTTGIILTHNVTLLYTFILVILYAIFNIKKVIEAVKNKKIITQSLTAVVFIIGISSFFLVPLLECKTTSEYAIFDGEMMGTNGESVQERALPIQEVLYKSSENKEDSGILYKMGYPILIFLLLGIVTFNKVNEEHKRFYIINYILGLICVIMATNFFPWRILPNFLCVIQFPWRMIGFSSLFLSIAASMNFCIFIEECIKNEKVKHVLLLSIVICSVCNGIIEIKPYLSTIAKFEESQDIKYEEKIIKDPNIGVMEINREYLPVKAIKNLNYIKNRTNEVVLLNGDAIIKNYKKENLKISFNIKVDENTSLEMPLLYYPGYVAYSNNEKIEITESENGFLKIDIAKGFEGDIIVEYKMTLAVKISYVVSIVTLIIFVIYSIKKQKCLERKEIKK